MLRSFRHKGLQRFVRTENKAGIQPMHAQCLRLQLACLDGAQTLTDMNLPGWKCPALKGDLNGHWAPWVDKNWRLTFTFEGEDAVLVDYRDYH